MKNFGTTEHADAALKSNATAGELGAAAPLSVELLATPVHDEAEIEAAVTAFARQPGGGLIVAPEPFMNTADFPALVSRHRSYFRTGATRPAEWREGQLTALRAMMTDRAEDFYAALWSDLRRNRTDADLTDVKFLAAEADHALSHLRQWMNPLSARTLPEASFTTKSIQAS